MSIFLAFALVLTPMLLFIVLSARSNSGESSDHGIEEGFHSSSDECYDYY